MSLSEPLIITKSKRSYIKYKTYTSNNWFNAVKEIQKNRPWISKRITDSMTASQVQTKMWIAEEMHNLKLYPENYVVLGGWFAHILTNILIEALLLFSVV